MLDLQITIVFEYDADKIFKSIQYSVRKPKDSYIFLNHSEMLMYIEKTFGYYCRDIYFYSEPRVIDSIRYKYAPKSIIVKLSEEYKDFYRILKIDELLNI